MLSAIEEKSERLDNIAPDVEPLLAIQQAFFELLFSQFGSDDRTVSRCSQDAEHQACSPMPAIDRGWPIRIDPSKASFATSSSGLTTLNERTRTFVYSSQDRSDKSQSRLGPLSQPSRTPWKIHPLGTMVPSYSQNATFVGCVSSSRKLKGNSIMTLLAWSGTERGISFSVRP